MKKILLLVAVISFTANGWEPLFDSAYQLVEIGEVEFKNLPIDKYDDGKFRGYPAPAITDYDDDGLLDVVYGIFDHGSIFWTKNVGTKENAKFDEYEFFTCDGGDRFVQNL